MCNHRTIFYKLSLLDKKFSGITHLTTKPYMKFWACKVVWSALNSHRFPSPLFWSSYKHTLLFVLHFLCLDRTGETVGLFPWADFKNTLETYWIQNSLVNLWVTQKTYSLGPLKNTFFKFHIPFRNAARFTYLVIINCSGFWGEEFHIIAWICHCVYWG